MPGFARISVNIPQLTGLFDYQVPTQFQKDIRPGCLVIIPFGKQTVQGIVVNLLDEPSVPETKAIEVVLDTTPALTPHQIVLAKWMADANLSTLSSNLDMMLPPGVSQHVDILVELLSAEIPSDLTPTQRRIMALLIEKRSLRGNQLDAALPKVNWRDSLQGLVKRGLAQSTPILQPPSVRPKTIRTAQYSSPLHHSGEEISLTKKGSTAETRRQAILEFLREKAIPVNVSWVYVETGATSADLNTLAELGLIRLGETEIWRDPLENLKPVLTQPPVLTREQDSVWQQIRPQLKDPKSGKPNLLVGVTGSGKTEIYLLATEEALKQGKGAIILVPEISLTPQTVKRFFSRFPGQVGLIHSRLSPGERYDTWRRIRSGKLPIVVGPRSALFAPLANPGLIVIDECHDGSFHQEEFQPHYHTIDTAVAFGKITGASILMGSATPEVETVHLFKQQGWNTFTLPNRVLAHFELTSTGDAPNTPPQYSSLPEVVVVDMRKELTAGNRSALSRLLHKEIELVLERQEQAILFLNRRGSASYVFCRDCGAVLRCPRCDTQLSFHAGQALLICHTCNYKRQMPQKCPKCGSTNIRQFGMGTESLEKLVVEQFPSARVLRWDSDTTRYKGAHDLILDHFIHHRADILIGTQMLAKGLDLPLVTLVGVILADVSLNMPDFRAPERTFQLLTQVAGRAGRSALGGKAVLQTFQPDHYAITCAAKHDTQGFLAGEMLQREKIGYPPFSRLLKIELHHSDPLKVETAAVEVGEHLTNWITVDRLRGTALIGPVPCFYARRAGVYRWQILIRGPNPKQLIEDHPLNTWLPSGMEVDIVVDPVNFL